MSEETLQKYYAILESAFVGTLTKDVIPGIIHNFANPLNSIMGRGHIMKRRIENTLASKEGSTLSSLEELIHRLKVDIESIIRESDRFFNMFQVVSSRFQVMADQENEIISLPRLIATELNFAEHYLDFKHQIQKNIDLNGQIPSLRGNPAYVSLCLWALLRQVVLDTKNSAEKTLSIKTYKREDGAVIEFCNNISETNSEGNQSVPHGPATGNFLFEIALKMLEAMGIHIDMTLQNGFRKLCLILKN